MNNGRPNQGNAPMGGQELPGQGMPPSYAPYRQNYGYPPAQPQQPAPGPYGYAPAQQPAPQPYGYGQQPAQSPYGYTQPQQSAPNSYGAPQPGQGMPNAYGAAQPGQGIPNSYGAPQNQPAQGPYGYGQPSPYGYGQPQQTGYQRPQGYPPYQGTMVPQPGPLEPPAPLPPVKKPRKPVNVDGITRLVVFLALPLLVVLFVLSMVFGTQVWLKWAFAVPALLVILAMWIRPIVTSDLKLTISFVMGAMIVVAVVSALSGAPKDNTLPGGVQSAQDSPAASETPVPQQLVDVPHNQPDIPMPTDPPQVSSGLESDAARQLETFLYMWQNNDADQMLALCAPSWVNRQALPLNSLFSIMTNRTAVDWELTNITGTDNDSSRTISVTINIDRNNGREPRKYLFKVIMLKENDNWYVDPDSLDSNEPEATATPESAFITQPPEPSPASGPNQVLYYNPRGGSKYHLDPDCSEVGKQFKPMTAITYADLFTDDYDELTACNVCGAPLKEN